MFLMLGMPTEISKTNEPVKEVHNELTNSSPQNTSSSGAFALTLLLLLVATIMLQ